WIGVDRGNSLLSIIAGIGGRRVPRVALGFGSGGRTALCRTGLVLLRSGFGVRNDGPGSVGSRTGCAPCCQHRRGAGRSDTRGHWVEGSGGGRARGTGESERTLAVGGRTSAAGNVATTTRSPQQSERRRGAGLA